MGRREAWLKEIDGNWLLAVAVVHVLKDGIGTNGGVRRFTVGTTQRSLAHEAKRITQIRKLLFFSHRTLLRYTSNSGGGRMFPVGRCLAAGTEATRTACTQHASIALRRSTVLLRLALTTPCHLVRLKRGGARDSLPVVRTAARASQKDLEVGR